MQANLPRIAMPPPLHALARFAALATISLTLILSPAPGARAQGHAGSSDARHLLSLPAGSLATSLDTLARQTGMTLLVDAELVQGKMARQVSGRLTARQALDRLLQGSGLAAQVDGPVIAIRIADVSGDADGSVLEMQPIEITGENIRRRLLDTNTSVNVQTSEKLERSNDDNIQDVFKRTANVISTGVGVQSFDFSIRGINTDGVGGAGQEGLASIIIDGANTTRVQSARGITSLFDVERIEILRGPQSTNQGKNSLAGAVVVKTKDPEFERSTLVRGSYGSFDTYDAAIATTGPISDDFAYRIALQHQHTDGFLDNKVRNEDDYAFESSNSLRAKLLYAPAHSPLEVLLSHTMLRADTNNDIESYEVERKRFVSRNPFDSDMDTDHDITTLNVIYDVSDSWEVESISTYNKFDSDDRNNNFAVTLPTEAEVWRAGIDQEEFSQELRLNYKGEALNGVAGVYYSDFDELNTRDGIGLVDFSTPLGTQNLDIDFFSPTKIKAAAVFAEFDFKPIDELTLTAGFRYERLDFDLSTAGQITLQPSGFVFADLALDGDKDQSVFLPKLAATYALSKTQRVGFTYSEGYRPGGVDLDIFGGSGVTDYDSEYTKNYELSYKGVFNADTLAVNANLFFIDWEDMQTSGSENIRSGTFNAGKSSVYGGEFEVSWAPMRNLDTYLALGYAKTRFDEFLIGGGAQDFAGNEFANAPRLTAAIGGYYKVGRLTYGAEVSYRDSYYDSISNDFEVDSLTLVNLSLAYQWKDLTAKAFANNVFDRVVQSRSATQVEGETLGLLTDPRVVGVQVEYRF